jgi:prophage regulatory protein
MIDKIYRLPDVMAVTGLCRTAVYNALADKTFPEPVKLGKRAIGWREGDLCAWVASRQKRIITK